MARNPYARTSSTTRGLYSSLRTEPDMRQELIATLDGTFPEIAKAQPLVFRKMRSDDDGNLIECACIDILTKEPDKDTFCNVCFGERYIWDETIVDGYKVIIRSSVGLASKEELFGPGTKNIPLVSFYFKYDSDFFDAPPSYRTEFARSAGGG